MHPLRMNDHDRPRRFGLRGLLPGRLLFSGLLLAVSLALPAVAQEPLTDSFTYQGQLHQGGNPASGVYDFRFSMHDSESSTTPLATRLACGVVVERGRFVAELDFGKIFDGNRLWLQLEVAAAGPCDVTTAFDALDPYQELVPTPYAHRAVMADETVLAQDSQRLDGKDSTEFLQMTNGTVDVAGNLSASGSICDATGCIGMVDWSNILNLPQEFAPSGFRQGDFDVSGNLRVRDDTTLDGDLRVGTNGEPEPRIFLGSLMKLESFFGEGSRIELRGDEDGDLRDGILLNVDEDQGGEMVVFDGQPEVVPNTIHQTVVINGRDGSRGGQILIRDGLRSEPTIELSGYDTSDVENVAMLKVRGNVKIEVDGNKGGRLYADNIIVEDYLQLGTVTSAPPSSHCNDSSHWGRMVVEPVTNRLHVCMASGWVVK